MIPLRRLLLKGAAAGTALPALLAAGLLRPAGALAADWNARAFDATTLPEALRALGMATNEASRDIQLKAPEIAENGAAVPIEISSSLPEVSQITLLVEKNPQPLSLQFNFAPGVQAFLQTQIKMAQTSNLRVIVKSGSKQYHLIREVKVTQGGCGE
ncbi:MAG: thiosulfate oxidation carrier protein SoxY [Zoogloea sp.]|nr:thiosulfate oxidation carrier protein SoxY [Zoogloea sp.]